MTREPAEPLRLDYLIRAGTIHSMTGKTYCSVMEWIIPALIR